MVEIEPDGLDRKETGTGGLHFLHAESRVSLRQVDAVSEEASGRGRLRAQ